MLIILLLFCFKFSPWGMRGNSSPSTRDQTGTRCIGRWRLNRWPPGKSQVQGSRNTNPKEADFHWAFSICSMRLPAYPGARKHEHEMPPPWSACAPDARWLPRILLTFLLQEGPGAAGPGPPLTPVLVLSSCLEHRLTAWSSEGEREVAAVSQPSGQLLERRVLRASVISVRTCEALRG